MPMMNAAYEASRDQLDTSYAESARRARLADVHAITGTDVIDSDDVLKGLIDTTATTALTERDNGDGPPDNGSPYETRGYLRWVGQPEHGWLLPVGGGHHVTLLRKVLPVGSKVTACDRCGGTAGELTGHLVDAPPHLVAFFLDDRCRTELGLIIDNGQGVILP